MKQEEEEEEEEGGIYVAPLRIVLANLPCCYL
jgi:hypothetical protein